MLAQDSGDGLDSGLWMSMVKADAGHAPRYVIPPLLTSAYTHLIYRAGIFLATRSIGKARELQASQPRMSLSLHFYPLRPLL